MLKLKLSLFLILFIATSSQAEFGFTLKDLVGNSHNLKGYRGQWVAVNFCQSGCVLHVLRRGRNYPALNDENDNISAVLGINFWESDLVRVKKFVTELPVEFPILLWPEPEPIKGLGLLSTLPTGILTAPDGEVKSAFAGMVDVAVLKSYIDWQKPKTK